VVSPDGCRDLGAGYARSLDERSVNWREKSAITDHVVSALLVDAVDREVKAFGCVNEFS
jgi:hypothetical protein